MTDLFAPLAQEPIKPVFISPFPDKGIHRCSVCAKTPAPFGIGSIQKPKALRYFCQKHWEQQP